LVFIVTTPQKRGYSLFARSAPRSEDTELSNAENHSSLLSSEILSVISPDTEKVADYQPVQQQQNLKHRLRRQTQALIALAKSQTIDRGDLKAALREITEVTASVLEVERASVWLYQGHASCQTMAIEFSSLVSQCSNDSQEDYLSLKCLDLYEQSRQCHSCGMELPLLDHPAYLQALATEETIAADDAQTDSRTQEFADSYLTPNGITSLLDAPIWLGNQIVGILRHEHLGKQRRWILIEENFVAAIATLVASTIQGCAHVLAQKQQKQSQQCQNSLLSPHKSNIESFAVERPTELTTLQKPKPEEINSHSLAEAQLRMYQNHFEELVVERTQQILKANKKLQQEILTYQLAQEKLQTSISVLHATLNSTTDGIVTFNPVGEIVSFNQKFVQMWGITDGRISLNHQELQTIFLDKLKEPEAFLSKVRQFPTQSATESYDLLELLDGRIIEHFCQPQRIGKQIIGRVSSFRDITERARAEGVLRQHLRQAQLIALMCDRIRQSLNLEEILKTTVEEVRQFLHTDRVLIYRLENDSRGKVVVESVATDCISTMDMVIYEPCFTTNYIEPYQQGSIRAITDIYTAGLMPCYVEFLAQFQVRANLVVPIMQTANTQGSRGEEQQEVLLPREPSWQQELRRDFDHDIRAKDAPLDAPNLNKTSPTLWGLLIAHHCSEPRQWQQSEIDLLKSLATQVAIAIQQSSLFERLEGANRELKRLACMDGLTKVANRRRFDEYLTTEWQRLAREQKPLSLILCDVDYFKFYNDTYGHLAGDSCLQQIASVLCQKLRHPTDLVARFGGEEFALILPNTDTLGAVSIAQTVQEATRSLKIAHRKSLVNNYVTLSLGIASTVPTLENSPTQLIGAADQALYQAKAEGRDCLRYQQN